MMCTCCSGEHAPRPVHADVRLVWGNVGAAGIQFYEQLMMQQKIEEDKNYSKNGAAKRIEPL